MLEAAVQVARAGELSDPVEQAPAPLRQFFAFAKYPPRALEVARRVLDEDEVFRARVLAAMRPDALNHAGRLFLERGPGWQAELGSLVAAQHAVDASQGEARTERRATKQLELTKGTLAKLAEELDHVTADLAAEQARSRDLEARVREHQEEADRLRDERTAAVRELKVTEARDAARLEEVRALRERLREMEEAREEQADAELAGVLMASVDVEAFEAREVEESLIDDPAATAPAETAAPTPPLDLGRVGEVLGHAADAAGGLAAALAALREEFDAAGSGAGGHEGPASLDPAATDRRPDGSPRRASPRPPVARRRPTRLPVGVFDDSPEAVGALLRIEGMQVLVDGYNVSLTGWPALDLELQRARLLDVLGGLEASTPATFVVVFDGATTGYGLPKESRLRSVQVRFTTPAVEADDVLLEMVAQVPGHKGVTVVSSDNRVRSGAARRGANVVGSAQLLDYIRGA